MSLISVLYILDISKANSRWYV